MSDKPDSCPDSQPFEFGCSTIPFVALYYMTLVQTGHRLEALAQGTATPSDSGEEYFLRCIRYDADYDSHECTGADAWRQLIERRAFERNNPPPGPHRTWIRETELRPGMILFPPGLSPVLLTRVAEYEYRGRGLQMEFRIGSDFPWHERSESGQWRVVTCLESQKKMELFIGKDEMLIAADGLDRVMTYLWRNSPDDDMLILDTDADKAYHIPPDRISSDICEAGALKPNSPIRVQWWDDKPLWVWGPA